MVLEEDGDSSTVRVTNEEALQRPKGERNILHAIQRRKDYWHGHNLRRNNLLKHVIETKTWGFCVQIFCSKLWLFVKEEYFTAPTEYTAANLFVKAATCFGHTPSSSVRGIQMEIFSDRAI
jgi:hypothetical protein